MTTTSMLKRAQEKKLVTFEAVDIRQYTNDKHRVTDDRPYGGGAGMVLKIEPLDNALSEWKKQHAHERTWVVATSASGRKLSQTKAQQLLEVDHLAIVCGHYEGVDQRVLDYLVDEEIRVGEYILTGGEPAAAVIADVVTRLVPGVLGNEESIVGESHSEDNRGHIPQYTRPVEYKGWRVPEVLLSGNHAEITTWREKNRTRVID